MKKKVGEVTSEERYEMHRINEHLHGLEDLLKIITEEDDKSLYDEIISDLSRTKKDYKNWWNTMSSKYEWEHSAEGKWEINFETCEIFLNNSYR